MGYESRRSGSRRSGSPTHNRAGDIASLEHQPALHLVDALAVGPMRHGDGVIRGRLTDSHVRKYAEGVHDDSFGKTQSSCVWGMSNSDA
jgi:hypothetical protein